LRTTLTIRTARQTRIDGPEADRVRRNLETMQRHLGLDGLHHHVRIDEAVPAHAGLGSGTQIALAVAAALRRLHDLPLDTRADAVRLGRGARSGVGIGLFDRGGVVVDGGRAAARDEAAPVVSAMPFPERWRAIVVLDPARQGAHGEIETAAFAKLPPFPDAEAAQLCRLVLMKALPALADCDIENFGAAVRELQARLGSYFAPVQGGRRFISPDVAATLEALDREGAVGIGQSSWGPTGFAFAESPGEAERLASLARRIDCSQGLDIRVCAGLNRGAVITTHAAADAAR